MRRHRSRQTSLSSSPRSLLISPLCGHHQENDVVTNCESHNINSNSDYNHNNNISVCSPSPVIAAEIDDDENDEESEDDDDRRHQQEGSCCVFEIVDDYHDDETDDGDEESMSRNSSRPQSEQPSKHCSNSTARSSVTVLEEEDSVNEVDQEPKTSKEIMLSSSLSSSSSSSSSSSPLPSRNITQNTPPLPSSQFLNKALGIWKKANQTYVKCKSLNFIGDQQEDGDCEKGKHQEERSHQVVSYALIRDKFVDNESQALLFAIRCISSMSEGSSSSCSLSAFQQQRQQLRIAFTTLVRFAVKDLRLFAVLLPCFTTTTTTTMCQSDFIIHVVLGKVFSTCCQQFDGVSPSNSNSVFSRRRSPPSSSATSFIAAPDFCQQTCVEAPSTIVDVLADKFVPMMGSDGEIESESSSSTSSSSTSATRSNCFLENIFDAILNKLDYYAHSLWNKKEKQKEEEDGRSMTMTTATTSTDGSDRETLAIVISGDLKKSLLARKFSNRHLQSPDRLAICALVRLFSLVVKKIVIPMTVAQKKIKAHSKNCAVSTSLLVNWIEKNCPFCLEQLRRKKQQQQQQQQQLIHSSYSSSMNPNQNIFIQNNPRDSAITSTASTLRNNTQQQQQQEKQNLTKNIRRFRMFVARVDQTVANEMIRCWSALAKSVVV